MIELASTEHGVTSVQKLDSSLQQQLAGRHAPGKRKLPILNSAHIHQHTTLEIRASQQHFKTLPHHAHPPLLSNRKKSQECPKQRRQLASYSLRATESPPLHRLEPYTTQNNDEEKTDVWVEHKIELRPFW